MKSEQISRALDLPDIELPTTVVVREHPQIEGDFEYARGNMIAVIEKGQEALSGILDVAGMSQHPRAFEVAATLLRAVSDANKDLLELSKRKQELTGESNKPNTINNNLFVGSTAELQKLIKNGGN